MACASVVQLLARLATNPLAKIEILSSRGAIDLALHTPDLGWATDGYLGEI